ncbi:Ribonuclease H-like domain-containing protein [Strongyloides ratti]|uniref:Ribonuclease H-like domain-containing protein n=1 Tax=Strongyloides ratti TaxID=34506 RepID=A0A090L1M7_STRRB|nr:Ribonuclease H-like domain-containing protein [Strongyloides ratti]CEF61389.1 Ribonuclease H-like domain-containing protein [Strongyloides ratti]
MVKLLKNKSQKQLVLFFGPLLQAFPWSILVSDSELALCGPDLAFQFQKFHVHHITSVSYFPASSGLLEKYIHILKVKVSKFRLSELSLPMSVKAAANAMNHFASSKRQISAVQLFFTAYDKKIDYLPFKETAVPHKKIYFLPNGKLFSIYLERIFIAKLGSRVNNGHGVEIFGMLNSKHVIFKKRGYLRRKITSPRMEVEALVECLHILRDLDVSHVIIFSDNSYVVNSNNQE